MKEETPVGCWRDWALINSLAGLYIGEILENFINKPKVKKDSEFKQEAELQATVLEKQRNLLDSLKWGLGRGDGWHFRLRICKRESFVIWGIG